jgi:hypothetical protein
MAESCLLPERRHLAFAEATLPGGKVVDGVSPTPSMQDFCDSEFIVRQFRRLRDAALAPPWS